MGCFKHGCQASDPCRFRRQPNLKLANTRQEHAKASRSEQQELEKTYLKTMYWHTVLCRLNLRIDSVGKVECLGWRVRRRRIPIPAGGPKELDVHSYIAHPAAFFLVCTFCAATSGSCGSSSGTSPKSLLAGLTARSSPTSNEPSALASCGSST